MGQPTKTANRSSLVGWAKIDAALGEDVHLEAGSATPRQYEKYQQARVGTVS